MRQFPTIRLLFHSSEGPGSIVPLKYIEYGVYGDVIIICPKQYSIYLRGTIILDPFGLVRFSSFPVRKVLFYHMPLGFEIYRVSRRSSA